MLLRTKFDPWQHLRAATQRVASTTQVMDRRAFTGGTLAAAAMSGSRLRAADDGYDAARCPANWIGPRRQRAW